MDRTRCFAHIINLVAKSLLKMFDPPKKTSSNTDTGADGDRDDDDDDIVPAVLDLDELLAEFNDMERTADEPMTPTTSSMKLQCACRLLEYIRHEIGRKRDPGWKSRLRPHKLCAFHTESECWRLAIQHKPESWLSAD
ncbi:hypothetical protein B0H10DRAFT_2220936 [Mycena sp. CBHHK59/15]|nr:hypothetical protein B0H10DRAFT_2220936 [Mycena sp. CBHHK59/15]